MRIHKSKNGEVLARDGMLAVDGMTTNGKY